MRCDRIFLRREYYFLKAKAADEQAIFSTGVLFGRLLIAQIAAEEANFAETTCAAR